MFKISALGASLPFVCIPLGKKYTCDPGESKSDVTAVLAGTMTEELSKLSKLEKSSTDNGAGA